MSLTQRLATTATLLFLAPTILGGQGPRPAVNSGPDPKATAAAPISPSIYSRLPWRTIGPEGNRFTSAAGIPGDPLTYYVGSASGGIYKTSDGGVHWTPIFDDQPVASI